MAKATVTDLDTQIKEADLKLKQVQLEKEKLALTAVKSGGALDEVKKFRELLPAVMPTAPALPVTLTKEEALAKGYVFEQLDDAAQTLAEKILVSD